MKLVWTFLMISVLNNVTVSIKSQFYFEMYEINNIFRKFAPEARDIQRQTTAFMTYQFFNRIEIL